MAIGLSLVEFILLFPLVPRDLTGKHKACAVSKRYPTQQTPGRNVSTILPERNSGPAA